MHYREYAEQQFSQGPGIPGWQCEITVMAWVTMHQQVQCVNRGYLIKLLEQQQVPSTMGCLHRWFLAVMWVWAL